MQTTNFKDRLRLFAGPREPIRSEAPSSSLDGRTAVMRLYDPVDSWGADWGVSAKEFAAALDELPANIEEIRLHINSPGGEVFEGIAILNSLRNHAARVVAVVDSLAASAASFIAAGADEVVMARNSQMMIHDAWGLVVGNAQDMRNMADDLDRVSDNIASIYADKAAGQSRSSTRDRRIADWRTAMARETWYTADEAVAAGLADRVDGQPADAAAKNRFDLSIFTYAGREAAPDPDLQAAAPAAAEPAPDPEVTAPNDAEASQAAADEEQRERQAQRARAWLLTA